ncbi:Uma2 family endonuclease [Kovacikia minuta CCNUW1]|uniref:Uma2 family endonuclease n=1 Tax=Kovacikia minuta TaxID=2931930 RepID=UPI001CD03183|nr:Uma2 family endonuclease [Kovacikia minuta]UBF24147.1 Uma2 family endonuclease [Kovacikia minuta CCNUW1]
MVALQLRQLSVPSGQRLVVRDVNWEKFEAILEELGDHRAARIAYYRGVLEIRMPSREHEVDKGLIGDMVKILLEELEVDCECFGSTKFKNEVMESGIEPDQCFYIKNHELMRGRRRVDLSIDPPPDLAIEVDVTSKTQLDAYAALGVAELWRFENGRLQINVLEAGKYQPSPTSSVFPSLSIVDLISECVERSLTVGRSPTLRAFRSSVRQLI